MTDKILRTREVMERTGLSRTTIWRKVRAGKFPAPLQLTENAVGWPESRISKWFEVVGGSRAPLPADLDGFGNQHSVLRRDHLAPVLHHGGAASPTTKAARSLHTLQVRPERC